MIDTRSTQKSALNCLIVEMQAEFRQELVELLRRREREAVACASVREAVEWLDAQCSPEEWLVCLHSVAAIELMHVLSFRKTRDPAVLIGDRWQLAAVFDGFQISASRVAAAPASGVSGHLAGTSLRDAERELIDRALAACKGNRTAAAKMLQISVRTLQRKLSRRARDEAAKPLALCNLPR